MFLFQTWPQMSVFDWDFLQKIRVCKCTVWPKLTWHTHLEINRNLTTLLFDQVLSVQDYTQADCESLKLYGSWL